MDQTDFRVGLNACGLTLRDLARELHAIRPDTELSSHVREVASWASGARRVPAGVALAIRWRLTVQEEVEQVSRL